RAHYAQQAEVCAPSSGRPEPERTRRLRLQAGHQAAQPQTRDGGDDLLSQSALLQLDARRVGLLTPIEADDDRDEFGSLGGGEAQGPRALQRRMFVEAIGVRDLPDQSALRLQQQILFVTV